MKSPEKGILSRVVAALIDGTESTLKTYSRRGDEIILAPVNIEGHQPRTYHASRVTVQGVLIDVVRRGGQSN